MTDILDRVLDELIHLRTSNAQLHGVLGKTGERLDGVQIALGSVERQMAEARKRHSDRFERVEKRAVDDRELAEKRDLEMWERLDDRLDKFDEAIANFFLQQSDATKASEARLRTVETQHTKDEVSRVWMLAIASGVGALVSGIIVAVAAAAIIGGSNGHASNESLRKASAGDSPVGSRVLAQEGRDH